MVSVTHCDSPAFWQTYLSDPASISMEGILIFNKHLLFLLTVIVLFVAWLLFYTINYFIEYNNKFSSKFVHSKELEIVWTSIPALLLLILSTPSFTLLYAMDEISEPELTLKILGHQWFWSHPADGPARPEARDREPAREARAGRRRRDRQTGQVAVRAVRDAPNVAALTPRFLRRGRRRVRDADART